MRPELIRDSFFRRYCPNPRGTWDLGAMYDELNKLYFHGKLSELKSFTVTHHSGEQTTYYRDLKWNGRLKRVVGRCFSNGVIELSGSLAYATRLEIRETLAHEMIHKAQVEKGRLLDHGPFFRYFAAMINRKAYLIGDPLRITYKVGSDPITKVGIEAEYDIRKERMVQNLAPDNDLASRQMAVIRAAAYKYKLVE